MDTAKGVWRTGLIAVLMVALVALVCHAQWLPKMRPKGQKKAGPPPGSPAGKARKAGFTAAKSQKSGPLSTAKVTVQGLRVVREGYGGDEWGNTELKPLNAHEKGTTLAFLVVMPNGGLIDLDEDASKVNAFTDNTGKNLLEKRQFGEPGFGDFLEISEDGKACMIDIEGGGIPSKGAMGIKASGTLAFKTATQKKDFMQKDVPFIVGSKINAGFVSFEIAEVGKPEWGDAQLEINLKTQQDISAVAEIKFLDATGQEIESNLSSWGSMGFGNRMTYQQSYTLAEKVNGGTILVSIWTDMKTQTIPFNINTGLGL